MSGSAPGHRLVDLAEVMARLRAECAWKAAQTHRSLARYLLEETHETLEAIDTGDTAHLREELGDLLLQVYFHAVIAGEHGRFDIDDVAGDLIEKLVRRNPHVFAGTPGPAEPEAINEAWEAIKATEKARTSVLDGLPPTLPALLLADKLLDRADRAGRPVGPEADDTERGATEIGERLLAVVAEARAAGVDPEQALRDVVRRHAADVDGPGSLGG